MREWAAWAIDWLRFLWWRAKETAMGALLGFAALCAIVAGLWSVHPGLGIAAGAFFVLGFWSIWND